MQDLLTSGAGACGPPFFLPHDLTTRVSIVTIGRWGGESAPEPPAGAARPRSNPLEGTVSTAQPKTYRNPRRAALAQLKAIKDRLQWCVNRWTVTGTAFDVVEQLDPATGRSFRNHVTRPRRADEMPENSAKEWETLYRQAEVAALDANDLAEFALAQWRRCLNEQGAAA